MICSFTQTYSNHRLDLLELQAKDKNLVKFKNLLDLNIFSFHDSSKETIKKFKSFNTVKNSIIFEFNDIPYTHCIRNLLNFLDEKQAKYLFFIQDDALSLCDYDYENLLKNLSPNMFISLGFRRKEFDMDPIEKNGIFNKYSTFDFIKSGYLSFDDSPYLSDIQIVKLLYDDGYFEKNNVWTAEMYMASKWDNQYQEKYVLDKRLFKNINTKGPCAVNSVAKGYVQGKKAKRFLKLR